MDRLIVLACLAGVAHSKICPNYVSGAAGAWTSTFQAASFNIGQEIVDIDEKMQKFCEYYSNYEMRQIYGSDYYQLSIVLPDFDEDTIQVRIMHRLLLVSATSCGSNYADIKLLPDVLDTRRAAWKYYEGELFIMFPYKQHPSTPIQKHCTWWIDPSKLTVPKMTSDGSDGNCFGFCNRSFGDGILRDNVWHASGVPQPPNRLSFLGVGHGANGFAGNGFGRNGGGQGWGASASHGGLGNGGHGNIQNGVFGKK